MLPLVQISWQLCFTPVIDENVGHPNPNKKVTAAVEVGALGGSIMAASLPAYPLPFRLRHWGFGIVSRQNPSGLQHKRGVHQPSDASIRHPVL